MPLDLVGDDRLGRKLHRLLDQRDGEVRDADVAREALLLHLAHRAHRLGERNLRVRPVDQQQVHVRDAQVRQALLHGALERRRGASSVCGTLVVMNTSSRFTPEACSPSPTSLLVAVDQRAVEMAVAELAAPAR